MIFHAFSHLILHISTSLLFNPHFADEEIDLICLKSPMATWIQSLCSYLDSSDQRLFNLFSFLLGMYF